MHNLFIFENEILDKLVDFLVLSVSGTSAFKFCNDQFMADVLTQELDQLKFSAIADQKGKTLSTFYFFKTQDKDEQKVYIILPKNNLSKVLSQLNKYNIFYKTKITQEENLQPFALFLPNSPKKNPAKLPKDLLESAKYYFFQENYNCCFFITNKEQKIPNELENIQIKKNIWLLKHLVNKQVFLINDFIKEYISPELELDKFDAISFTKGCYLGQEAIAKMYYRGKKNKSLLVFYAPKTNQEIKLNVLYIKKSTDFKKIGEIIFTTNYEKTSYFLCLISNKYLKNSSASTVFLEKDLALNLF